MTTDPHNRYLMMESTVAREVPDESEVGENE